MATRAAANDKYLSTAAILEPSHTGPPEVQDIVIPQPEIIHIPTATEFRAPMGSAFVLICYNHWGCRASCRKTRPNYTCVA